MFLLDFGHCAGVARQEPQSNSSKKTAESDTQTDSPTVSTCEAGTQTEYDVIYITDLARYFHDIADKLGAGASLYSMQVSRIVLVGAGAPLN